MGSELINRGIKLPEHIWSSWANLEAQEKVYAIHKDYINAGADYITANTFRATKRAYRKIGLSDSEAEILAKTSLKTAISTAKKAVLNNVKILGSIAPLEDCYKPDLFPGKSYAKKEFNNILNSLYNAGIDIFLLETMNNIDETICCLDLIKEYNIPAWVSFVLKDAEHILSGESLISAIKSIEKYNIQYLLINCNSLKRTYKAFEIISENWTSKWGFYPNFGIGEPDPDGIINEISKDDEFIDLINHAITSGASLIGGCCGSSPKHIELIKDYINSHFEK